MHTHPRKILVIVLYVTHNYYVAFTSASCILVRSCDTM